MKHNDWLTSLKRLIKFACLPLLLSVTLALGGCVTTGNVAVAPQLPQLPVNVKACIANHVKVPSGDWSVKVVANIIAKYQRREIDLEDCLSNVEMFYGDLRRGLAQQVR